MRLEDDLTYKAILNYIYETGRGYPNDIAKIFKFSRQAADYRLKKLLDNGYIKKLIDDDGRTYYILTDKGYNALKIQNIKHKDVKKEIYNIIKYMPLLPLAMGLIGLGKYISEADFIRGIISFTLWAIVSFMTYVVLEMIFKK